MELVAEQVSQDTDLIVSVNGRAAVRLESTIADADDDLLAEWQRHFALLTNWVTQRGIKSPFWSLTPASTVIECAHERPASHQAAQWIWSDLQHLSLATGTFPELSS